MKIHLNVNVNDMKVEITENQRNNLIKLWFIYGNRGPKSNNSQHKFIQWILEGGEYRKDLILTDEFTNAGKLINPSGNFNDYRLSDECINAVDKILFG